MAVKVKKQNSKSEEDQLRHPLNLKKVKMTDVVRPVKKRRETTKPESVKYEPKQEIVSHEVKHEILEEHEHRGTPKQIDKEIEKEVKKFEKLKVEEEEWFKKDDREIKKKRTKTRTYFLVGLTVVLLAGIIYSALRFLPRVEIKITTKKSVWNYIDSITAAKGIVDIDPTGKRVPVEVFSQKKNINVLSPASGKGAVERKATGNITIYNVYSSSPQPLVANTRFLTPDGKVFRLIDKVIVPGEKISSGKIVPSSVAAAVVADKPGDGYNVDPVSRFMIPGFLGSDKYKGFYAISEEKMTGGLIGNAAYPTDADIAAAETKARQAIQDGLASFVVSEIPAGFKILDGAKIFNLTKDRVNKNTDANGNFSVLVEGELSISAFREADIMDLLITLARNNLGPDFDLKDYKLGYGVSRLQNSGEISFPVNFEGTFVRSINISDFQQSARGKSEDELRAMIFGLPAVEKATVSMWPFWVKKVPDNVLRIKVSLE